MLSGGKLSTIYIKKPKTKMFWALRLRRERGIRTPGPVTVNGFQDRRIRPLCHLSGAKLRYGKFQPKFLMNFA
jgi:hypothetical protein